MRIHISRSALEIALSSQRGSHAGDSLISVTDPFGIIQAKVSPNMSPDQPGNQLETTRPGEDSPKPKYSVVIPVYNSAGIVGKTIDRTLNFFKKIEASCELVMVNDGSNDDSWRVLKEKAASHSNVIAINLLKNYGQHTANLCGFKHAQGDFIITMDDDLQNPPEEIIHLIEKEKEGHDVVYGKFRIKRHSFYRRVGSSIIKLINRKIFGQPKNLTVFNFRLLHRDVVNRITQYRSNFPYITGLALMYGMRPADVIVDHHEKAGGASNYSFYNLSKLVLLILFSYSSFPLVFLAAVGFLVSLFSFIIGVYFIVQKLWLGTSVPGWSSIMVLLAFFNGISILILSMIGQYIVRVINHLSSSEPYHISEIVGG